MMILLLLSSLVVVPLLGLFFYCRLTCGICKSSRHLNGKVVIVTGGNAGIGYETAKDLADRGAKVILACRSEERGTTARDKIIAETENNNVHFKKLDLASLASVRAFAEDIIENEERVDVLINNAGMYGAGKVLTEDGLLLGMQANHFGPFLLTHLLLDKMKASAPSRIINVSSGGYVGGKVDFDNLNMEKETEQTFRPANVYSNSKLFNILITVELARRLKGTGVTANSMHPGGVLTDIINNVEIPWYRFILPLVRLYFKSPWEGAQTTIYLAVSREVSDISGQYFADCALTSTLDKAKDVYVAKKLWEVSERLCKIGEK